MSLWVYVQNEFYLEVDVFPSSWGTTKLVSILGGQDIVRAERGEEEASSNITSRSGKMP